MLDVGTVLQNRYRVTGLLGQGGMGAVYRAWDTRLNIAVAIKEMVPQPGIDPHTLAQLRQQFQQEAAVLARLNHPNLVRVTDYFEESGNAYLVMDFVEGESLASLIARQGPLPEPQVLEWARQLLDALAYCHAQGVIHRDIKPGNVIIRQDGRPVLVDFGLVKLWDPRDPRTRTAIHAMGTPEYAPPEQYGLSGHTDPRSDLYSLGATLYHALTGQAPATATTRISDPDQFRPPRMLMPRITPRTEQAILRALELHRSQRWGSAAEMAQGLGVLISPGPPTPPTPQMLRQPATPLPQARPRPAQPVPIWAWAVGGMAVLLFLVALIGGAAILIGEGRGRVTPTPAAGFSQTAAVLPGAGITASPTLTRTPTRTPTPTRTAIAGPTSTPALSPTRTATPTRGVARTPSPTRPPVTPTIAPPTQPSQPTQPPPPPPTEPPPPPPPTEPPPPPPTEPPPPPPPTEPPPPPPPTEPPPPPPPP